VVQAGIPAVVLCGYFDIADTIHQEIGSLIIRSPEIPKVGTMERVRKGEIQPHQPFVLEQAIYVVESQASDEFALLTSNSLLISRPNRIQACDKSLEASTERVQVSQCTTNYN
jgi:hypothetical protein